MEDASLDDFLGGDDGEEGEDREATAEADAEKTGEAAEAEATDAADRDGETTGSEANGSEASEGGSGTDGSEASEGGSEAGRVDPATVEPATTTMAFAPSGVACEDCGAVVERRWGDDGRLVCAECKEW